MPTVSSYNAHHRDRPNGWFRPSRYCNVSIHPGDGSPPARGYSLQIYPVVQKITIRWSGWSPWLPPGRAHSVGVEINRTGAEGGTAWSYGGRYGEYQGEPENRAEPSAHPWRPSVCHHFTVAEPAPGFDWSPLLAIGRSICAKRPPFVILDWFMDNLPEPWRWLGEEPFPRFFAAVCPIPLAEAEGSAG